VHKAPSLPTKNGRIQGKQAPCALTLREERKHASFFASPIVYVWSLKVSCEGPQGKTSLASVPVPTMRTDLLKGEVDPALVKKHMHY
jgi:hypothetical protein